MKLPHLQQADQSKHWEDRESPVLEYFEILKKLDNDVTGKRILDVGCAEGREVDEFSKLGLKAEGIDIKEEFIIEARKQYPAYTFTVGSAEELPFEDNSYDLVFCINTLFYTDIEKSIPEFCRAVKGGGRCIISFDTEIVNLDEEKTFHTESIEHLSEVLEKNNAVIEYLGDKEERIDETPFKHKHTFNKIVFKKNT